MKSDLYKKPEGGSVVDDKAKKTEKEEVNDEEALESEIKEAVYSEKKLDKK